MIYAYPEVRAIVRSYMKLRELQESNAFPASYASQIEKYCAMVEEDMRSVTSTSANSRWARDIVGPVLAAGMGAVTAMRDQVKTATAALRIFGLAGTHPMSNAAAWRMMAQYGKWISPKEAEEIQKQTGIKLDPRNLSLPAVLQDLTRVRSIDFGLQMAYWLGCYFARGVPKDNEYTDYFRGVIGDLVTTNERGQMEISPEVFGTRPFLAAEWEEVMQGRLPFQRLEVRASLLTTRKFVVDYWERHQVKQTYESDLKEVTP